MLSPLTDTGLGGMAGVGVAIGSKEHTREMSDGLDLQSYGLFLLNILTTNKP